MSRAGMRTAPAAAMAPALAALLTGIALASTPGPAGRIAFTVPLQGPSETGISTILPGGTARLRVTAAKAVTEDSEPTWSPDGRMLALTQGSATGQDIVTAAADGSRRKALTTSGDACETRSRRALTFAHRSRPLKTAGHRRRLPVACQSFRGQNLTPGAPSRTRFRWS
jgi:hypothetical protein